LQLVVSDTGPIHYLILIGHVDILPALFETIILPSAVRDELTDPNTPPAVRSWIANLHAWMEIRQTAPLLAASAEELGAGETAAIALASGIHADLLAMDDRRGVAAALRQGLNAFIFRRHH
jgi:predicted nucleic acid-binding protein